MFDTKFSSSGGQFDSSFTDIKFIKGEDGFSPIITVENLDKEHKITITDKENTESFIVKDGQDGYIPVKGEDYFTPVEIAEIKNSISNDIKQETVPIIHNTTKKYRAYVQTSADKTETYGMEREAVANTIPIRNVGGTLIVGTPTEDAHATTKGYVDGEIKEIESLAKGAVSGESFMDYAELVEALNSANSIDYVNAQHLLVRTLGVPDLWIYEVSTEYVPYEYIDDEAIVEAVKVGTLQIGYYTLAALETQKVDLADYAKNTDYASATKAGVIKIDRNQPYGLYIDPTTGLVSIMGASQTRILEKNSAMLPITPKYLDYAVKVALSDSKEEWTDGDKQAVRELVNAVGNEDYATTDGKAGVIQLSKDKGVFRANLSPELEIVAAVESEISKKSQKYKPITPKYLDYAVKEGLANNAITLTDEEKENTLTWLGVTDKIGDIETVLDTIIAIQEGLIGGDAK